MNYKIIIAYDGTKYSGWQSQLNALSIQDVIQNCLETIFNKKIAIRGSGRTDTGVHAENQTAHFVYESKIDLKKVLYSLNSLLPIDIRIKEIKEAPDDFHSQYSAKGKIYHYHIHTSSVQSPFNNKYRWHLHHPLDLEKLKEASTFFLGTHDFTSFANESHQGAAAKNPVRTIKRIDLVMQDEGFRLEFEGDGFLYKMVRNITGYLVDVACGKRLASDIPKLLALKDRTKASKAAPARGLFLFSVLYD